ncbi:hypothetical protein FMN50_09995 [Rhodobacterales bacterium]|nr:hypothetical protein FMN50_09995 [Rhodobacterales bacterium]
MAQRKLVTGSRPLTSRYTLCLRRRGLSPTPNRDPQPDPHEGIHDFIAGGLCLILSSGLAIYHTAQAGRLHEDFERDPGPAFLPVVLLIALGLLGAALTIRGGLRMRHSQLSEISASLFSFWPAAVAIAILGTFLPLSELAGAAAALSIIGAALALLAGRTETAKWPVSAVSGALVGLVLFGVFRFGLSVPL